MTTSQFVAIVSGLIVIVNIGLAYFGVPARVACTIAQAYNSFVYADEQ